MNLIFRLIPVVMLVLILIAASCDIEKTDDNTPTKFEGTWAFQTGQHSYRLYIFKGKEFTHTEIGDSYYYYYAKGKFTYDETKITIKWTHNYSDISGEWQPILPIATNVDYMLNGDTLVLSNNLLENQGGGNYDLDGTWKKR